MILKIENKVTRKEAVQLTWENWNLVCDFVGVGKLSDGKPEGVRGKGDAIELAIPTLEGLMTANENDYIIKGLNGEFYPCKPDIFHKSYNVIE